MVAALPSEERVGPPSQVRLARVGNAAVLQLAVEQAATVGDLTEVMARSGDALRAAVPDTRTEVARGWSSVQAAGDLDGRRSWWVRGEVLQPSAGEDLTWTIELASDPDGPFTPVGLGGHEPDGDGAIVWELGPTLEVLGLDPSLAPGTLEVAYGTDGELRATELTYVDGADTLGPWTLVGDQFLGWEGPMALLPDDDGDGEPEVAYGAAVVYVGDEGGWGVGELYPAGTSLAFDTCWSAQGDRLYEGGEIDPLGDADTCPLPNPF
jgi:hypothetical protein